MENFLFIQEKNKKIPRPQTVTLTKRQDVLIAVYISFLPIFQKCLQYHLYQIHIIHVLQITILVEIRRILLHFQRRNNTKSLLVYKMIMRIKKISQWIKNHFQSFHFILNQKYRTLPLISFSSSYKTIRILKESYQRCNSVLKRPE